MSQVFKTVNGTPYLKRAGVVLLSTPSWHEDGEGFREFLSGWDEELGFTDYEKEIGALRPAEELVKFAGQLCYLSLGPGRTKNADAGNYLDHIRKSGHGSVFEHANFSFLFYGIDRSVTHELVRHRAGFAFSQVSQRYVSGRTLRFVERPEYQTNDVLHQKFLGRIDDTASCYNLLAEQLIAIQRSGDPSLLSGDAKTELRKKVNQCARSLLPNETEAPIVVTANVRAWRHFIEMRANKAAEVLIRDLAMQVAGKLDDRAPLLFRDYKVEDLEDGTTALQTATRKV